jgi:hypothetical protein
VASGRSGRGYNADMSRERVLDTSRDRGLPASLLVLFVVVFVCQLPVDVAAAEQPEPPRAFLDTTYSPPAGGVLTVNAGDDLQAALESARPGDTVVLEAGATFTGNFELPAKPAGGSWIYIQTSAYSSLPAPGTRVSPANAAVMPKIVSPNTSPAIVAEAGAHHYRLVGIEITTTHATTSTTQGGLAVLGTGDETDAGDLPHDITFDRTYVHGTPTGNIRRGITANSGGTAIIDSYIADVHEEGADTQAIGAWSGPGPFKIVNNYLEGAGENVMFGGADTRIAGLVPADIEIRRNHFFKPLSWKVGHPSYAGLHWSVKNLFELKNAQRILVDGNIFENNWADAQAGYGILLTPRNQSNTNPWAAVRDVTFTHNMVRGSVNGFNISGRDDIYQSQPTERVLIRNNVVEGAERLYLLNNGGVDYTIDHNTAIDTSYAVATLTNDPAKNDLNTNLVFRNNIASHGEYGVFGDRIGEGSVALSTYAPGAEFVKNIVAGGNPALYSGHPDNFINPPASLADVGFVDLAGGDYHLAESSPYRGAGTDAKDLGADIDAVNAAIQGVTPGGTETPPEDGPPAAPVPAPAPSGAGAPAAPVAPGGRSARQAAGAGLAAALKALRRGGLRALARGRAVRFAFTAPAGRVESVLAARGRLRRGAVLARARRSARSAGRLTVVLRPTAKGRSAARRGRRVKATLRITVAPRGGAAVRRSAALTLRR